nr:arylsulfatase [Segetibacter sp.]
TPLIAFWPAGIKVPGGSISERTGHVMDFMATFVELAKAKYPVVYHGNNIKPMQGLSLVPAFASKTANGNRTLFNEHFGARYVRHDGWKLVSKRNEPWHLFRIDDDETELKDLSALHPEIVQKMDKMWQDWTKENHVFPKQADKAK